MIKYTTDLHPDTTTHVKQMVFPGGEVGVDVNNVASVYTSEAKMIRITAQLQSANDIMALLLTTDALRRIHPLAEFGLVMAYLPYARQDRVCNDGEALSIKVFTDLINAQGYKVVTIADPHSPVGTAGLDRVHVLDQFTLFGDLKNWGDRYIVAPDQGATKKCEDFAKRVGAAGIITCTKHRELSTGKITDLQVNAPQEQEFFGKNLVVLDDICDGGRTFIELANALQAYYPAKLELMVTHGIFSKGFEIVGQHYDHVYTTDSFRSDLEPSDKLTILNIS